MLKNLLKFSAIRVLIAQRNLLILLLGFGINLIMATCSYAQLPVINSHPRIFLTPTVKTALIAKRNASDPAWVELKAEADVYATASIRKWTPADANVWSTQGTNEIFYSYCGSSWEEAAMKLGMAHQMTKTGGATKYSDKLLQFADEIIRAYKQYPPSTTNGGNNIFQFNSAYATRHVGKTIAVIYDWCYDELGASRKTELVRIMEDWFKFMREPYSVYQLETEPTGNYYFGHVICAAYMGYAIYGDGTSENGIPYAQQMIDFARQRTLGTTSVNFDKKYYSPNYFAQSISGGLPTVASISYLGPKNNTGAPQIDGIPVQGWSYGGATTNYLIDYFSMIKSATGEDIVNTVPVLKTYFSKTAEALVHAYTPNQFQYDNSNDNGSSVGCVADYGLALRLAAVTEKMPIGPNSQYFYKSLKKVNLIDYNNGYPALSWEKLLYDNVRPATAFSYKPFYPELSTNVYTDVAINTGLHKFYMRKDWGPTSTWATLDMGIGVYDAHNHNNAGHFKIIRGDAHDGDDHLLVGANEVAVSTSTRNGIGNYTNYAFASSPSNTLFIDDYEDFDPAYVDKVNTVGGQTSEGYDEPTHEEQNDLFSYFRADLTSAYFTSYSIPDAQNGERSLTYFYRSFLYLRNADIFVVYDKLSVKASKNKKGEYKKHLRWHFLNSPTISANGNITAVNDGSKLFIHTVIPSTVNVSKVDESKNPDDPTGGQASYLFNTETWRAEVNFPGNPLKQDFVTVLQPGAISATEMQTTAIASKEGNMEGSLVSVNGGSELILFNNSVEKYPTPIKNASYAFTGSINTNHTLCGLKPGANYQVDYAGSIVTVTEAATGNYKASPAGVLNFILSVKQTLNQTVSFGALQSTTYGAADFSPGATSTNATIPITYVSSNTNVATIVNGKIHITGVGTTDITASQAGDATYFPSLYVKQTLIVKPANLTITADAKSKSQGLANPTLTATYTGFVYNETEVVLTTPVAMSTTAITSSPIGDYPIKASNATANNYTITFVDNVLKITAAGTVLTPQTINNSFNTPTAFTYGAADFTPGAISTNATIPITYVSSNTAVATVVNGKIHITGAGKTTITASQAGNSQYANATDVTQELTVNKAELMITADIQVKILGNPNPLLSVNYVGFVYGEDKSVLTTPPIVSTTAVTSSTEGVYPITVSGATASNYNISYGKSTLTVTNPNHLPQIAITASDIQNIMSPNDDGHNDFWIIKNIELYPKNKVKVLDALGRVIYAKEGYDNTWDGKYKNKALATTVYYYIIDLGPTLKKLKGTITIVAN